MSVNFYLENWGVTHHDEPVHMLSSDFSVICRILNFQESGFFLKESIQLGEIQQPSYPQLKRRIIKLLNSAEIQAAHRPVMLLGEAFDLGIPANRLEFQLNALLDLITKAQKQNIYIYFG